MPRFAHIFEAAADTLNAYYQAVAEVNIDSLMGLWIDEEFVSCICADGSHLHGLDSIRAGLQIQFEAAPVSIEPLDIRVYDSLGTVVYAIAEAHRPVDPKATPAMVQAACNQILTDRKIQNSKITITPSNIAAVGA